MRTPDQQKLAIDAAGKVNAAYISKYETRAYLDAIELIQQTYAPVFAEMEGRIQLLSEVLQQTAKTWCSKREDYKCSCCGKTWPEHSELCMVESALTPKET